MKIKLLSFDGYGSAFLKIEIYKSCTVVNLVNAHSLSMLIGI